MNSQEAALKESRLILAAKNDLMGANGKLGIICRYLGHKIEAQNYFDPYSEDLEEIPEMEDLIVSDVGWIFDGLSRGINIEIKYLDFENKLSVSYEGYEVYCEIAGDLDCYVPNENWESKINKLYDVALKKKKIVSSQEKQEKEELIIKTQMNFLERLKQKWGW